MNTHTGSVDQLTRLYVRAHLAHETSKRNLEEITDLLKQAMRNDRMRQARIEVADRKYVVNYRQRVTMSIDMERLKSVLSRDHWDAVTTRRISKPALDKLLKEGLISPLDIAIAVQENQPITWVDVKEDDDASPGPDPEDSDQQTQDD